MAQALRYSKPENALSAHVDAEDKTTTLIQGDGVKIRDSIGREQHPTIINESGLYILIGLTGPNFGLSKSHCFYDKMV